MKKHSPTDPADNLPAAEVGEWSVELKHRLLREYVEATWGARSKYTHRAYVDLFSGPGRVKVKATGEIVDGSPLVAWRASAESKAPYTSTIIADDDRLAVKACETRLRKVRCVSQALIGEARNTARSARSLLNTSGLHLVFLDPYNLQDLPFNVFEAFFDLRRVDFIVHFSANDLQRNLDSFLAEKPSIMDDFAPGWRNHVTMRARDQMRGTAFWYWVSLFERQKIQDCQGSTFDSRWHESTTLLVGALIAPSAGGQHLEFGRGQEPAEETCVLIAFGAWRQSRASSGPK